MKRNKQKQTLKYFDEKLYQLTVPESLKQSEALKEALLNVKLKPKQKDSVKLAAAIKNYKVAVLRKVTTPSHLQTSLIDTLLMKHYKALMKIYRKYEGLN